MSMSSDQNRTILLESKIQSSLTTAENISGIVEKLELSTLNESPCEGEVDDNEDIGVESEMPLPKLNIERMRTVPLTLLSDGMLSRGRSQSPQKSDRDLKSRLKSANMTRSMPNFQSNHRASHNRCLGESLASECRRSQSDARLLAMSRVDEFSRLLGEDS